MSKTDHSSDMKSNLSRRTFVKGLAAAGVTGAFGAPFKAGASTPNKGGTFKIGLSGGSTTDSMDPILALDQVMRNINLATYDTLVELQPDGQLKGSLLENFETGKDAADWILDIRKGVEFHDGKSLDADDVIYSIGRHLGEDSKSPVSSLFSGIDSMKADGKNRVRISLKSPNADFAYYFNEYKVCVSQDGFTDWANPVGCGGYKLSNIELGVSASGERNPNYFKEGRAHVDSYELTVINDSTARVSALNSGQVHAIDNVDRKTAKLLDNLPNVNVVVSVGKKHHTAPMTCTTAPFDNNDVRLALKYAIDREQVLEIAFSGYGSLGNDHPVARTDPFFHSELPQRAYDSDKAAHHLKKSGLDNLIVELFAGPGAGSEALDTAQLFKESGDKVEGLSIDIKRVPADGYWKKIWMKEAFFMSYWSPRPTADMILSYAYHSSAKYNEARFSDAKFDQLIDAARGETDFAKRKQMYWDAQEILNGMGGSIIFAFADLLDAHDTKINGFVPDSAYDFCGARAIDRVWFA